MWRRFCSRAGAPAGLAVLLLAVCAVAVRSDDRPGMVEYRTEHYEVQTDMGPGFARLVGAHMEEIRAEYLRRFEDYGQARERYEVVVYGNEESYKRSIPGDTWGSTGVFMASEEVLAAHMGGGRSVEEVLRTLYHEGFHQFMYCTVTRDCPIWLNEGLAEYFSEATWNGQGFTTGMVPSTRLHIIQQAISQGAYVPFRRLFAMSNKTWKQDCQRDHQVAYLYYCQVWSIVQFLAHADGERYADRLNSFLKAISDGDDAEDALAENFGTDLVAFEQAWAGYMMGLAPSPKFRCRDNMQAIMLLAGMVYRDPKEFDSPKGLRRELLHGRYREWQLTLPNGRILSSSDVDGVNDLFRCPFGNTNRDIAYLVVASRGSGMPTLVYDELKGVVITAYYKRKPSGELGVVVEELVRDTVPEPDRRAVIAARREQFD